MGRFAQRAGVLASLGVLLHPFYFVIYRLMVFETLPRDDYAPFLLWLIGQSGGQLPPSPYGYRILSVIAAAPFYYALPAIPLSNIPESIAGGYLKASAAIAALSYLSLIAASMTVYFLAIDRAHLKPPEAACASAFMFVFGWYASIVGIDTFAILLVCLGLYVIHRRMVFAALLIASVACNEKVAIVFVLWLTTRWILCKEDRPALLAPWLTSISATAIYLALVSVIQLPGHRYQLEPAIYPLTFWENLTVLPTARGLLLNILPVMILSGAALLSWRLIGATVGKTLFRPVDVLVAFEMALVSTIVTHQFQMGRIAMHAAALYALPIGLALGSRLSSADPAAHGVRDAVERVLTPFDDVYARMKNRKAEITWEADRGLEPAKFKQAAER